MTDLALNLLGDIPEKLAVEPTQRMVSVVNQLEPAWLVAGAVNLKLVDDQAIRQLNKEYSGHDYATDVLSFSYLDQADRVQPVTEAELGDMVISVETARRQAVAAGTTLADELATLALHGLLHIFGFDHAETAEREAMDRLQADILSEAGVKYRNFNWV